MGAANFFVVSLRASINPDQVDTPGDRDQSEFLL